MMPNYSFHDYLSDSFERSRALKEYYATSLFSQLAIVRPDLTHRVRMTPDDLYSYDPKKWNRFLTFVGSHWHEMP